MIVLKGTVCAMLLAAMALCPRLWFAGRTFPTAPAIAGLPDLPLPLTLLLSGLLIVGLVAVAGLPRPRLAIVGTLAVAGVLVLFDLNRLQPWFFQGLLLLLGLTAVPWQAPDSPRAREAWAVAGFVLVATYGWSGLQKANLSFADSVFPWFLQPFGLERLRPAWFLAPLGEIGVGVLLCFPRTRGIAIAGAVAMHALLLLALGPLGHRYNAVVWPWNLGMPVMAAALFFRNPAPLFPAAGRSAVGKGTILVAGLLPALNFAGLWDDYLAFSLYSGRARQGFLFFTKEAAERVPERVRPFVQRRPDRVAVDIDYWGMEDLNIPPYPEVRVYREVARRVALESGSEEGMRLLVSERPGLGRSKPAYRWVD